MTCHWFLHSRETINDKEYDDHRKVLRVSMWLIAKHIARW